MGLPGDLVTPSSLADPITQRLCFRRPDRERRASTAPFHLDEAPRTGNSIATGSRMEVTMAGGGGGGSEGLKSREFLSRKMNNVGVDGGDGYTTA